MKRRHAFQKAVEKSRLGRCWVVRSFAAPHSRNKCIYKSIRKAFTKAFTIAFSKAFSKASTKGINKRSHLFTGNSFPHLSRQVRTLRKDEETIKTKKSKFRRKKQNDSKNNLMTISIFEGPHCTALHRAEQGPERLQTGSRQQEYIYIQLLHSYCIKD